MISMDQMGTLPGRDVRDPEGNKIGTVGQIWDDGAGHPGWASVKTGLFGLNESLVPITTAEMRGDEIVVPFDKSVVKDAPNVDASHDEPLEYDDVERLYEYYGLSWEDSAREYEAGTAAAAGYDAAGYDGTGPAGSGFATGAGAGTSTAAVDGFGAGGYQPGAARGYSGTGGYDGTGASGVSGVSDTSGVSGASGASGVSGASGAESGYRGAGRAGTDAGFGAADGFGDREYDTAGRDASTVPAEGVDVQRERSGRARLRKHVPAARQELGGDTFESRSAGGDVRGDRTSGSFEDPATDDDERTVRTHRADSDMPDQDGRRTFE